MQTSRSFIAAFLLTSLFTEVKAQDTTSVTIFFEKVYLHTDRSAYSSGETIWFKAYLTNAQTGLLSSTSNTLYAELIGPDAKIVRREFIRIDKGMGNGDFLLPDTIAGGVYRLRAYTNWMKNFGNSFVFEKKLVIQSFAEPAPPVTKKKKGKPELGEEVSPPPVVVTTPVIQFFPEGGSMIAGVPGIVAFMTGEPVKGGVPGKGEIRTAEGEVVAGFESAANGMGQFLFTPAAGKIYRAIGTLSDGRKIDTPLPEPLWEGFSLSVRPSGNTFLATVGTNETTWKRMAGKELTLVGRSRGEAFFSARIPLKTLQSTVSIPAGKLPPGIGSFTLYDEQARPAAERLIFVNDSAGAVTTRIRTDKAVYGPKEKVTVMVDTYDKRGFPVAADLSLAVVSADLLGDDPGIVPYLMLQSEIQGPIRNAANYFDPANPLRLKQLDLLLLTQGWRDYTWKRLADSALRIRYAAEQGITVTGMVRDAPPGGTNISLRAIKAKGNKLFATHTDEQGRYYFDGLELYGYQPITVTSVNSGGQKKGKISLDSLFADPLPVDPMVDHKIDTNATSPAAKLVEKYRAVGKISLKDTIRLNEVQLKKDRMVRIFDGVLIDFGYKEEVFHLKPEDKQYKSIRQYLLASTSSLRTDNELHIYFPGQRGAKIYPHIIANGRELPYDGNGEDIDMVMMGSTQDYFLGLAVDKVNEIRIKHMVDPYNHDVYLLVLNFKMGLLELERKEPSMISREVNTYYEAKTFYVPDGRPVAGVDLRNTLYWNPAVKTGASGKATLTFYTSDEQSLMKIIAEGIGTRGQVLAGKAAYEVK